MRPEILQDISFHDSGLIELRLDFEKKQVTIRLEENAEIGGSKQIRFSGIGELVCDSFQLPMEFDDIEVHGAAFKYRNQCWHVTFTFLIVHGPSFNFSFSFDEIVVH